MKLTKISAELFNQLSLAEPESTIFQSTYYANYMTLEGYRPVFLQAVNDRETCVGLAMLLLKKKSFISRKNTAFCPNGYLVNFYDREELIEFDTLLKQYLKEYENADTMIIEPNILLDGNKNGLYLKHAFDNIGYAKIDDIDYYQINTSRFKKIETNKNTSFIVNKVNNSAEILEKYVESDSNQVMLFNALNRHGSLFEVKLDSFRTKSSLRKNIDENNEYIGLYKNDLKFRDAVDERSKENEKMNILLHTIDRYEKALGDNPGLALCFVTDYSDQHLLQFIINRDSKDNLFEINETIVNNLVEYMKNNGIKTLGSFTKMPNSVRKQLLGRYTISL